MINEIAGRGWLRTTLGSSTASYSLRLKDADSISPEMSAEGLLRADITMMVEAQEGGRATLVLENGRGVAVRVLELAPEGLRVRVDEPLSFWPGADT